MPTDPGEYVTRHQALKVAQEAAHAVIVELGPTVVKDSAEKAANTAVREVLTEMGINTSDPDAIIQQQVDMAHLRRHRKASERWRDKIMNTAIGVIVVGALATFWLGFQIMVGGSPR